MIQFIEVTPATRQPADKLLIGVSQILAIDRDRDRRGEGAVVYLGYTIAGLSDRVRCIESYEEIRAALSLGAPT